MTKWTRYRVALVGSLVWLISMAGFGAVGPAAAAVPDPPYPQLQLNHIMVTSPFASSTVSMDDNEGSAYVPQDGSLWLADDNGRRIYEVNPVTGALKRTIGDQVLTNAVQYGGGPLAGGWRNRDLEAISYDATNDVLYVFSGKCCTTSVLPTAFRLVRDATGTFQVDSYQPLPTDSDFTGAAWNPADGKLYVGVRSDLRSYDYVTNTVGPNFSVPHLTQITGMVFSPDGTSLFVTNKLTKLSRVNWSTKTLVSGWNLDMSSFGVQDARAVEIIGDQLWVSDGYDFRPTGDPKSHAVFVFDVTPPPPDFNIVTNGDFELNTAGWNASGNSAVTLEQAAGGESGSYAARLTNTGSTATTITLNDSPNSVDATYAGTYRASAWVRSDTGTGAVYLRIREYQGSNKVSETWSTVKLTNAWQKLTIAVVPTASGTSTLDLNVWAYNAPAGTNLYVDDVQMNFAP